LNAIPESGEIGFAFFGPGHGTGWFGLLSASPSERATAFTARRGTLTGHRNRHDHEDRSHGCRGDQGHRGTRH